MSLPGISWQAGPGLVRQSRTMPAAPSYPLILVPLVKLVAAALLSTPQRAPHRAVVAQWCSYGCPAAHLKTATGSSSDQLQVIPRGKAICQPKRNDSRSADSTSVRVSLHRITYLDIRDVRQQGGGSYRCSPSSTYSEKT